MNVEKYISQINQYSYPKSLSEKYNNLFLKIISFQKFDGGIISFDDFKVKFPFYKLYFKTQAEFDFYVKAIGNDGLITFNLGMGFTNAQITFKGLEYALQIQNKGLESNNCFVAISFNQEMNESRAAIKDACEETGFNSIFMDEENFDSELTINEAMLAKIKSSKFCIIDFTKQRQNVYFEAGYALGIGIKVIYCCNDIDAKNIHFDTRQFPHIRYSNSEDLKSKLIDKIEVWIKE